MDSAHLALVQSVRARVHGLTSTAATSAAASAAPAAQPEATPTASTARQSAHDAADEDATDEISTALSVPPLPIPSAQHSHTLELLMTDVGRCIKGVEVTASVIGGRFEGLMNASATYLDHVAVATGDHCDFLLQASSFLEFQASEVHESGMNMLHRMRELHRDMASARTILKEIQQSTAALACVEEVLTDMERERGMTSVPQPSR